jgi:hypothetical protein
MFLFILPAVVVGLKITSLAVIQQQGMLLHYYLPMGIKR